MGRNWVGGQKLGWSAEFSLRAFFRLCLFIKDHRLFFKLKKFLNSMFISYLPGLSWKLVWLCGLLFHLSAVVRVTEIYSGLRVALPCTRQAVGSFHYSPWSGPVSQLWGEAREPQRFFLKPGCGLFFSFFFFFLQHTQAGSLFSVWGVILLEWRKWEILVDVVVCVQRNRKNRSAIFADCLHLSPSPTSEELSDRGWFS